MSRKCSLCKLWAWYSGMGGGSGKEADKLECRTMGSAEQDCWTPASLPVASRVTALGLHRSDHWAGSRLSALPHQRPHKQVSILTAQQSLTQVSPHHAGDHSPNRKFFRFILPSQHQCNILIFLSSLLPSFYSHLRTFFHCFLERKGEKETSMQERSINQLLLKKHEPVNQLLTPRPGILHAQTGDWTCSLHTCPDLELNPQPFGYKTMLQSTEPHWSGLPFFFKDPP